MKIAICEDSMSMAGQLENIVHGCFGNDSNQYTCDVFLSGEELIERIKSGEEQYQIYILDIELKEIDGLSAASYIRKTDFKAVIIFVTSHRELMQEAFEVAAFHYLIKPIDKEKTRKVILKAIDSLNMNYTLFRFHKRKKIYSLYFGDIQLFESQGRKILIYTGNQVYEYYGTLKELHKTLDSQLFAQIHNSYIVNMDYIHMVEGESITMSTGKQIFITKKFTKLFHQAYRNYILKKVL